MHRAVLATFVLLLAILSTVAAQVSASVHVDPTYDGSEGPSDGSSERPFSSIDDALATGDGEIVVHGGEHNGSVVLEDVVLMGDGGPIVRGRISASGDVTVTGFVVAPPAWRVLVIDLEHGGQPSERATAWRDALGEGLVDIVRPGDDMTIGPAVSAVVLAGEGSDIELETALAGLLDSGIIVIIDGPVGIDGDVTHESLLAPMAGAEWSFTLHAPSDTLLTDEDFGGLAPPVEISRLNGGYYYLSACGSPAVQAYIHGEWRPLVGLSRSGVAAMAMPLISYDQASRRSLVEGLLGTVPLVVSEGSFRMYDSEVEGDILSVSGSADLTAVELEGVRITGGEVIMREWLTLRFEDFERRPLSDVDVLVGAGPVTGPDAPGRWVVAYSTASFGGSGPSPGPDGVLRISVPRCSYGPAGGPWDWAGTLEIVSNWAYEEGIVMDGPMGIDLRSPDPAPRAVGFAPDPFALSGTVMTVSWNASRDADFDSYELTVEGSDGSSRVVPRSADPKASFAVDDGVRYDLCLEVMDTGGRRSAAASAWTSIPNLPPPAAHGLSVAPIDTSSVSLSWEIDGVHDLGSFEIWYSDIGWLKHSEGAVGGAVRSSVVDANGRDAVVGGLAEDTVYWFRVVAVDVHGATAPPSFIEGKSAASLPEITFDPLPVLASGDVAVVSGAAVDDRWIVDVEYSVDGEGWRPAAGRERWAFFLDASRLSPGEHEISVRASDGSTSRTESHTVEVDRRGARDRTGVVLPPYYYALVSAAAFLAVMALTQTGMYLVFSALVLLYARMTGRSVLDNYIRGKIHGYIIANPGDHYSGIMRRLNLSNGLFAYHVKVLERESLVKSVMDGRLRRFYPIGMKVEFQRDLDTVQVRVLNLISENPGITQKEIVSALGLRKQLVNLNVRAMYHAGLIDIVKRGRETHLYLIAPEGEGGDLEVL